MQDLTPQLRTRLSRVERAVGLFVVVATVLLLVGFSYYLYQAGTRRGWFVEKVRFCTTLPGSAAGLRVGDPVKLMGFDVGEITRIDAQPPDDPLFNVYVEFNVRWPYFGYLWTVGTKVKVSTADFLGNRVLEVTKGTAGWPTHLNWPVREYSLKAAGALTGDFTKVLVDAVRDPDDTNVPRASLTLRPIDAELLDKLARAGHDRLRVADKSREGAVTTVWDLRQMDYVPYSADRKPYWLEPDEQPALTERLDSLVSSMSASLTNQLPLILTNLTALTANANLALAESRPLLSNLVVITRNLSDPVGSLGRWAMPPELYAQVLTAMTNANDLLTNATIALTNTSLVLTNASAMLTTANTNLTAVVAQLNAPLEQLATIVSNLNTQVQANTNFVTTLHSLLQHTDEMMKGLQRHWLFRSAFKEKATNEPPRRVRNPRGAVRY